MSPPWCIVNLMVNCTCAHERRRRNLVWPALLPVVTLLAFTPVASASVAPADGRVALVGNHTYPHIGRLPNSENDAADMAAALSTAGLDGAQPAGGALAIDERHPDRHGFRPQAAIASWQSSSGAQAMGHPDSAGGTRAAASRGVPGGIASAGCLRRPGGSAATRDPSAVEASLNLDRATRRLIQQGLRNDGFDPGVPDGLFGPRTRAAIRQWQEARGIPSSGYLSSAEAELLRAVGMPQPAAPTADVVSEVGAALLRRRANQSLWRRRGRRQWDPSTRGRGEEAAKGTGCPTGLVPSATVWGFSLVLARFVEGLSTHQSAGCPCRLEDRQSRTAYRQALR